MAIPYPLCKWAKKGPIGSEPYQALSKLWLCYSTYAFGLSMNGSKA